MATMTPEIRSAVLDARDWTRSSQAGYAAKPYVEAILRMPDGATTFGADDLDGMLIRLVGNLAGWRGPKAKAAKLVLRNA